jgi:hypothetical protein
MMKTTLLLLFSASFASAAPATHPQRGVEQIVTSSGSPQIEVVVDPELRYLGTYRQPAMEGRAEFEQYVFADARQRGLGRVFIVHFEHVLPGVDFSFKYPRFEMVRLGDHEYLHQSWPLEDWDLFRSPAMEQMLARDALQVPRTLLVDRYVRALDGGKAEIILFYIEPAGELPAPAEDLGLAGAKRDLWKPIEGGLAERARAVFRVRDHGQR